MKTQTQSNMTIASMVKVVSVAHQTESVNEAISNHVWAAVEDGMVSRPSNNEWVFYVGSLQAPLTLEDFPKMVKYVLKDVFNFEVEITIF